MPGHRAAHARRRRRPVLVTLLATLGSLVGLATALAVVAAVLVGGVARSFDDRTGRIADPFPSGQRPASTSEAVTVLLIGSDARADHPENGGRSDALLLAQIAPDRSAVHLMSIMRDSWVDVPGHGRAKINAAYAWGGAALTVQTVEQLLDVRVDHVAEIDFAGFAAMTDAVGGVTVRATQDFDARGHRFVSGPNAVDGDAALAFVRERAAFPDADHTRVRNQQAFLHALLERVVARDTLTDPGRLRALVDATGSHLAVDDGLDARRLLALGWSLRAVRPAAVRSFTLPTAGDGTSPDGQSIVLVNEPALSGLSAAFRSGAVGTWLDDHP